MTIFLVLVVLLLGSPEHGKRSVGNLVGKELSVMKHIKNKEAGVIKNGKIL